MQIQTKQIEISGNNVESLKAVVGEAFLVAKPSLSLIEERITKCLDSDAEILTDISSYLLHLGGKRIRPLLCALSGQLFEMSEASEELIDVAAGIEMIHMATLLHDDIIDKSPLRRHQTSAYQKYGLCDTLLCGDFLLVRAFGLCAHLDTFVVEETEQACVELTEGEVLEGRIEIDRPYTLDDYVNVVSKKTGSLFALAACVGAHLAGADEKETQAMKRFGYAAGIAFQMVDDVLDIVADQDLLGKPAGTDLKQKTPSLVNILWYNSKATEALDFFKKEQPSREEAEQAILELKNSSFIEESRKIATSYAEDALSNLDSIANTRINENTKAQLSSIVEYTLSRCH